MGAGNKTIREDALQDIQSLKRSDTNSQFCSKCNAWRGELGLEPDYNLYLDHLVAIYDEVFRVLRPDGCCFVNIGDTYGTHTQKRTGQLGIDIDSPANRLFLQKRPNVGLEKSLCLIPQRFAIKMLEHKWVLRNWITWHKPNPMPSSAKDRFTIDSESVFMLVKSNEALHWVRPDGKMSLTKPDHKAGKEGLDWQWGIRKGKKVKLSLWDGWSYYFEPQYEPLSESTANDNRTKTGDFTTKRPEQGYPSNPYQGGGMLKSNPLGRNKRTTWTIPTEAFSEAHFATFPRKLVEPMILAGCPKFVCSKCGAPRKKVYETDKIKHPHTPGKGGRQTYDDSDYTKSCFTTGLVPQHTFKGYSDCGCGEKFVPGICIDPFAGSLTVAVVCDYLNRDYIMIELNPEYIKMGKRRIGRAQGKHYIAGETQLTHKEQQRGQQALFGAK